MNFDDGYILFFDPFLTWFLAFDLRYYTCQTFNYYRLDRGLDFRIVYTMTAFFYFERESGLDVILFNERSVKQI